MWTGDCRRTLLYCSRTASSQGVTRSERESQVAWVDLCHVKRDHKPTGGLVDGTDCPVFVLDERRRVRFFNRGCVELTGCQPGDVIGKPCDYLIDPLAGLSERILHAIAPPAEVFGGQELFTSIEFIDARGAARKQHVFYLPLPGEGGRIPVVLGVMLDFHDVPRQLLPHATQQLHVDLTHLLAQQTHHFQASTLIASWPSHAACHRAIETGQEIRTPPACSWTAGSGKVYLCKCCRPNFLERSP
ncbi:MAG: PAS domain-containing protein [Planctomycetaceae bacterium]